MKFNFQYPTTTFAATFWPFFDTNDSNDLNQKIGCGHTLQSSILVITLTFLVTTEILMTMQIKIKQSDGKIDGVHTGPMHRIQVGLFSHLIYLIAFALKKHMPIDNNPFRRKAINSLCIRSLIVLSCLSSTAYCINKLELSTHFNAVIN